MGRLRGCNSKKEGEVAVEERRISNANPHITARNTGYNRVFKSRIPKKRGNY